MMDKMAECYEADGKTEEAAAETERALGLIAALKGEEKIDRFSNYAAFFRKRLGKLREGR